jgi:hypothetical protein
VVCLQLGMCYTNVNMIRLGVKMTNKGLSEILGIKSSYLTRRCTVGRGNHLAWLTRKILLENWGNLGTELQTYLLELLGLLVSENSRLCNTLDQLFSRGYLVYRYGYLVRLGVSYNKLSPFILGRKYKC